MPIGSERVRLIVCEVKDVDLPIHREDAFDVHERFANKVRKQLETKAEWVV